MSLRFDEYQDATEATAVYPRDAAIEGVDGGVLYTALGLVGEAGPKCPECGCLIAHHCQSIGCRDCEASGCVRAPPFARAIVRGEERSDQWYR